MTGNTPPLESPSVELLARYRSGDEAAAVTVYRRYAERLLALARERLSSRLAKRLDAEDVLQSAFHSFFRGARADRYALEQSGDLWRLLSAIVLNKLRRQVKRQRAAKRAVGMEQPLEESTRHSADLSLADREPAVNDLILAADELNWLFKRLEPTQRKVVELRLREYSLVEIAAKLNVNERTVRRWITVAQHHLTARREELEIEDGPDVFVPPRPLSALRLPDGISLLLHQNFRLEKLIGSGGICKAYLASCRDGGQRVCVKVLRRNLRSNSAMVASLLREAQLVARLNHPNIVPVHGVGELPQGGVFLALKWIEGNDLGTLFNKSGCNLARARAIMRTVTMAVDHAHHRGVLHCDLKPPNVLVDHEGTIWVTDFGFGRMFGDLDSLMTEHGIGGTPGFMAPEQYLSKSSEVGPWTDVYGLGALLHALIVGRPPDCGHVDHGVPETVRGLIQRCLADSPADRYSTAAEFLSALELA